MLSINIDGPLLTTNPVLPAIIVRDLEKYLEAIEQNISAVGDLLNEAAKEMPERYPTLAELEKSAHYWLTDKFNHSVVHLEPKAKQVFARSRVPRPRRPHKRSQLAFTTFS